MNEKEAQKEISSLNQRIKTLMEMNSVVFASDDGLLMRALSKIQEGHDGSDANTVVDRRDIMKCIQVLFNYLPIEWRERLLGELLEIYRNQTPQQEQKNIF